MDVSAPLPIDVTDHAVLRWLERVCGADIEAVRDDIRTAIIAGGFDADQPALWSAGLYIDVPEHRVHLVVRDGQVVTVNPSGSDPDA